MWRSTDDPRETMTTYDLFLESGPKRRKTMVHVPALLGCVAVGPTTDAALDATPDAIRAYLRFLQRHGEPANPADAFAIRVVEHITEGDWLGNGSPYITLGPDLEPLTDALTEQFLNRAVWLLEDLADWVAGQSDAALDAAPESGRTARAIVLHVLGAQGSYLSAALAGAPGFGAVHAAAERGELPLSEAPRRAAALTVERVRATTPEQRNAVRDLSSRTYTLRKAFRRMLEHGWEHLVELSRRPGGPSL
jgi:predicted RNase H-like HicB family nuclease